MYVNIRAIVITKRHFNRSICWLEHTRYILFWVHPTRWCTMHRCAGLLKLIRGTCCRMYFHYIYKASMNFLKVTANCNIIDFYIHSHLIYNVIVFIFVQNFITCKMISYCFNSKVNLFLIFNILYKKQNIWALCFIF